MNTWIPEPWPEWPSALNGSTALDRPNYARARTCVNALAGMNPDAVAAMIMALGSAKVALENRPNSATLPHPAWERVAHLALDDINAALKHTEETAA